MSAGFEDWLFDLFVLESAVATPCSVDDNIKRGKMAMKHVISSHKLEPRAMYRKDIGWIGFEWGKPGDPPPYFKNNEDALAWWKGLKNKYLLFKRGHGISHIIAKRDWEGKWIKEFIGQKGTDIAYKLVEVLAKGRVGIDGTKKIITYESYIAYLTRPQKWEKGKKREEEWLLTGYKLEQSGYQFILESADGMAVTHPHFKPSGTTPTCPEPYGTRNRAGAANSSCRIDNSFDEVNRGWLYDL